MSAYETWEESIAATLSVPQKAVLQELFETGAGIFGGHVARSAEVLIKLGCAQRTGYAENGIRQKIRITQAGREVARHIREHHHEP